MPVDFRALIVEKMRALNITPNRLYEMLKAKGGPSRSNIYSFLEGKNDMGSRGVALILEALEHEERKGRGK